MQSKYVKTVHTALENYHDGLISYSELLTTIDQNTVRAMKKEAARLAAVLETYGFRSIDEIKAFLENN